MFKCLENIYKKNSYLMGTLAKLKICLLFGVINYQHCFFLLYVAFHSIFKTLCQVK